MGVESINEKEFVPSRLLLEGDWPTVIVGGCAHFDVVKRGFNTSLQLKEYFSPYYNSRPVLINSAPATTAGRFFYNEDLTGFNFNTIKSDLLGAMDKMSGFVKSSSEHVYVGSVSAQTVVPGYLELNDLELGAIQCLKSLWLGTPSRVSAHFDMPQNLVCNLIGRRRFTLYPPDQIGNLYIGPIDKTPAGQAISLVDSHSPDFDKYPRFKTARRNSLELELEPGDVLFVPSMWWHEVEALSDFNFMQNYWYSHVPSVSSPPIASLYNAILSLRNLPCAQKVAWRALFDHYIWGDDVQDYIPSHALGVLGELNPESARTLKILLNNYINRN